MAKRKQATRTSSKRKQAKSAKTAKTKKWSAEVKTVSTFPPEGTFAQDAETVARVMATKKVSPKGLGSAIKMVQFFINRAGKNLSARRKRELEKAKRILQQKLQDQNKKRAGSKR